MSAIHAISPVKNYDGNQAGLYHFLDDVLDRADSFGWLPILHVKDDNAEMRWITSEFGLLTVDNLRAHAEDYMGKEERNQQASECLRKLIKNSVAPSLWDEIKLQQEDYTCQVIPAGATAPVSKLDGAMMLFALTRIVAVESRATVSSLLKQLNAMERTMEESKSDLKEFSHKVRMILVGLKARKTTIPDILPNLFEGYKSCGDRAFVEYMSRKEEEYEDGTLTDLKPERLMRLALEQCESLKDKQRWLQKSETELEFIAMTARLEAFTKQLTQKRTPKKKTEESGRKAPWANDGEWTWKGIAPKSGEPKEKQFKGRWYVHCPYHRDTQWVLREKKGVSHVGNCNARKKADATSGGGGNRNVAMHAGLVEPPVEDGEAEGGDEQQFQQADEATVAKCLATLMKLADK